MREKGHSKIKIFQISLFVSSGCENKKVVAHFYLFVVYVEFYICFNFDALIFCFLFFFIFSFFF